MRYAAALAALVGCLLALGCGGGSVGSQTSQQGQPTVSVATGSHVLGDANAKVTIVEFSDFQCPYCKSFATDTEPQIISTYVTTGKAKIAYRNFPLPMHQYAEMAAEASECAAKLGGNDVFWKYHDTLFSKGKGDGTGLDASSLKQYAADLGLNTTSFNSCLDSHEMASTVSKDVADGTAAGVQGTPIFFINGKAVEGAQPFSVFKAAIDALL